MEDFEHLMLAPESVALADIATDLAIPVVAAQGLPALTPQAIAHAARCSRQAVHQWFGSRHELQKAVARRFTARWEIWCQLRVGQYGAVGLLPDSAPVLAWTRVWLALTEAAPRDPDLTVAVRAGRAQERAALDSLVREPPGPVRTADLLHALLDGLRWQLVSGAPGSGFDDAAAMLNRVLGALRTHQPWPCLA